METEFILRLTIFALRLLIATYGDQYEVNHNYIFFLEGERIVVTGEFKDVEKIILCDNELYINCGFQAEQKIILKGQTQILLEISTYPYTYGDPVWYHTIPSNGKGYRFIIGQIYDQIIPIDEGGY